jgi:hypothetical protein
LNQAQGGPPLAASEAYAAILYGAIAADGAVSHGEAIALTSALSTNSMFRGLSEGQLKGILTRAKALHKARGAQRMLAQAAPAVPADLRDTVFAQCVHLVMVDDEVGEGEVAYLKQAQAALGVPDGLALKIVEVVQVLNKG